MTISLTEKIPAQSSAEQTLWDLEHTYFRVVQNNDLPAYLTLWHKDFLGWPSVSATPVQKDGIANWITAQTSKGLTFKLVEFKPAAIQVTGNIAVTCYWITSQWLDKDGHGPTVTTHITHTWLNDGKNWSIIGGMSMPEAATPQK